ncbi:nephronectin isoform X2 [Pleuronectes platessa]|uniref:nephronectin isoform X2 n=1 Tax=Pleuronectes platessa TaxID=8262 RepID=UPI00232A411D|nr:nephronectin isoform X2 [Pleuronectes platessa]
MITRVSLVLLSWLLTWSRAQQMDSNSWMSNGLCRYGNSVDCCWGWTQTDGGRCQPHCQQGCKHGECVGPDRCKCHAGYSGKACNQDLNECGLKPRPCKHRCMNTPGSYKCYCLDGYTLQPDGSCKNTLTCYYANCQYGCAVSKGRVLCTCPSPGLRLGPDRRTCIDIDECVSGGGVCPRRRKCVNTFGSFLCKCHLGFKLTYMNGRYVCIDKDTRPFCSLNPSSPKCRCKDGGCEALPRVTLEPPRPRTTIPIIPLSTAAPPITTTAQPVTTTTSAATTLPATSAATTTTAVPTTTTTTPVTTTTMPDTTTHVTTSPKTTTETTTPVTTTPVTTTPVTTTPVTTPDTTTISLTTPVITTPVTTPDTTTHLTTPDTTTTPVTTTPVIITTTPNTTTPVTTTTTPVTTTTTPDTTTPVTTTPVTTPDTTTPVTTTETTTPVTIPVTTTPVTTLVTTPDTTTTPETTPVTTPDITTTPVTTPAITTPVTIPATTPDTTTPVTTTLVTSPDTTPTLPTTFSMVTTTLNNRINKDVTLKQRGDVHIPRHPDVNQLWEFDIELGNISDDAKDDPDAGVVHCTFNHGLCDWLSDREGDLHWETSHNPAGGQYLSVPELKAGQRSIRGARLAVQILPSWSHGDLCFSFSHWLTGHHVGVLQLFTRKRGRGQRYSPALWSRTGGHGWRHTQVTLTTHHLDRVLLKAERRVGRRGQIAVDDVSLRQGACR